MFHIVDDWYGEWALIHPFSNLRATNRRSGDVRADHLPTYLPTYFYLLQIILSRIPNPTSPAQIWGTYPYNPIPGLTKFYYLAQLGWWFHQVYVINTEKRRKDHWQMFGHHILSITLISSSYAANFTRVGTLIHVLMDFVDIILPVSAAVAPFPSVRTSARARIPGQTTRTFWSPSYDGGHRAIRIGLDLQADLNCLRPAMQMAKMLRYLSHTTLCDLAFVVFLISWFVSRQIGLFLIIRTLWVDAAKYITLEWSPSEGKYLDRTTFWAFFILLSLLYVLATMWFCMAMVVAVRVVRGLGAEDIREEDVSGGDDDDSDDVAAVGDGHVAEKDLDAVPPSVGTTSAASKVGNGSADLKKRR